MPLLLLIVTVFLLGLALTSRRGVPSVPLTVDVNIVCHVLWVQTGLLHSKRGLLMFSFVSLCHVVSQHSSQVNAVAPSTLSVLPKQCPPVLSEHADLETKRLRGWDLNRQMGPV